MPVPKEQAKFLLAPGVRLQLAALAARWELTMSDTVARLIREEHRGQSNHVRWVQEGGADVPQ